MPSLEEVTRMAFELSADERTMLIERLLQSLEDDAIFDIDETSIRDIEERLEQSSAEEVNALTTDDSPEMIATHHVNDD